MGNVNYQKTTLKEEIIIKKIVTVHYIEYSKNFIFEGETHDFWEFVYVDKGKILVTADDKTFQLNQGEIVFHKPNEFHSVASNGVVAPNIAIVSFECSKKSMEFFNNKVFFVTKEQNNLLSQIMKEATRAFLAPIGDLFISKLTKRQNPIFGSEQLLKIHLEQFLISLYRDNHSYMQRKSLSVLKDRLQGDIVDEVIALLQENIENRLSFNDIMKFSSISASSLKNAFKEKTNMGVITYYNQLKIDKAKSFIREDNYNFTQIAEILSFESIHYFSQKFKKITGMSPTEYACSVKIRIENL